MMMISQPLCAGCKARQLNPDQSSLRVCVCVCVNRGGEKSGECEGCQLNKRIPVGLRHCEGGGFVIF